ncbi:MAG: nucleoside hydrolase [Eubacteriales bacterium]|nr:nucleoside hydrolase [Eubacteriales bacterium]
MKKIILDCDPGMDDSMAIVMAAKSQALKLMAVTTVNGNYPADVTCVNARKVLEMLGREEIPVAKGMERPMVRNAPKDPFTHGKDGQAENFLPDPEIPLDSRHAVDLLIDLIKENPGEITVVATGPMSNIAMAITKAPEIKSMIKEIIAISGAFGLNEYAFLNATGDTPQSEWNVYVDPEASKLIYESGIPMTALGLDVATHFDVDFTEEEIKSLENSEKKEAHFLRQAIRFNGNRGFDAYCTVIDCMAVAYAIDSSLVQTMKTRVGVETKDGLTLGMTVVDRRHHHIWENLPIIEIGCDVDYERFLKLVLELVLQ